MRALLAWATAASLLGALSGLAAVDLLSFRRTRHLRTGRGPERIDPPPAGRTIRSSSATHLPWLCGALMLALAIGRSGRPSMGLVLAPAGAFVAWTGWSGRVVALHVGVEEGVIQYRRRRRFPFPWDGCSALRIPRTPLGGWRIETPTGARTLMPSDLLGAEILLEIVLDRSGMTFDGRRWVRPPVSDPSKPT